MPLFDATTGAYNDASFAYDTHAALGDEPSIFESLANVVTKGIPLTGLSIVNSFANTGIQVANWFGADLDQWSIDKEMSSIGADDYASYYQAHQDGIEAAGLLAGSFIPGGLAIKAMKLAQAGKMTSVLQRATGIFSAPRAAIIERATQELGDGGALFNSMSADKFKAIALGFGDQALQALAFETAVAGTMHASPLLDQMSMGDTINNMFFGAIIGGGVGGILEGIGTNALLNRARLSVDTETKVAQISTRLGYKAGASVDNISLASDKVMSILDSLDKLPAETGASGAPLTKAAAATRDKGILAAKAQLQELVKAGDEDVSNAVFDTIYKAHISTDGDKAATYDYLAQLAKITRIGEEPSVPAGDRFYLPRFVEHGEHSSLDTLATTAPRNLDKVIEQRYELAPFALRGDVKVINAGDKVPGVPDLPNLAYDTSKEAFSDGADIFINLKGQVIVNNQSETIISKVAREGESRPLTLAEEKAYRLQGKSLPSSSSLLYGAPLILRTSDGSVLTKAVPVIGDFGAPSLNSRGIQAGDKFSLQSLEKPSTTETSSLDANARYVWAAKRGIKANDSISQTDIPMLEQLYREATASGTKFEDYMQRLQNRKISIEGMDLPTTPNSLLNTIRSAKDSLISELMQKEGGASLSSEDISRRANVPEKYLSNQFGATQPSDYMIDPKTFETVNHAQLEYNIGQVYQDDGNILRGLLVSQYRINLIKDAAEAGTAKYFGPDYTQFLIKSYNSNDATITGAGPGLFSFSNAAYGTLGQATERVGRFFTNWMSKQQGEVARVLTPVAMGLRSDPVAAAEANMFTAVRRRTGEAFTFLPDELKAKYGVVGDRAVLTNSLIKDKGGNIIDWNAQYTPSNYLPGVFEVNQAGEINSGQLHTYYDLSPKVAQWERVNQQLNDARVSSLNDFYTAQGINKSLQTGNLYAPPIDTAKYPYFALVKARPGYALSDDGVAVITAHTAADLEEKMASLRDNYSIYTKDMLKDYHLVQGDYEYNRNFSQARVNNDMRRRGILNDIYVPTNAESVIEEMTNFHNRQAVRQGRDFIELGNAQLFAELRSMGENVAGAERSQTGYVSGLEGRTVDNPYNSYIRTALGVSDKDTYRLWTDAQEKLEAFGDSAFNMLKNAFGMAKRNIITYDQASAMAEKFGLGNPYNAATDAMSAYYDIANKLPAPKLLSKFVSTANSVLASATIRLDAFQSMINIISSPILMSAEFNSAKQAILSGAVNSKNSAPGTLTDLLSTELPDNSGRLLPSATKAIFNSVSNWFNPTIRGEWLPIFKDMGIVRESSSEYFKMIDALTLPYGKINESAVLTKINDAVEFGSKLSGSQSSENFARFVAADTARQLFSAAGKSGTDLLDNIGTFVNRVHGNYVGSQRPIAFQGPIGQAMSLFQTYQFNLMQQLFRYVENGEAKSIAILAGLQSTIFGMQGLPGFAAINNHLVGNAAGNPAHKDIYTSVTNLVDKKVGDYLLYGVASNWMQSGLYSRGDINPRQISILPINPLDFPAISGGVNFVSNLLDTADKVLKGGQLSGSLLLGLEHNGISRPLAGLGQMMQGFVTNQAGQLISSTSPASKQAIAAGVPDTSNILGANDFASIANYGRLLGARPLDEAIAMDAMYRKSVYIAKDTTRIQDLGEAAKTYLYGNGEIPGDTVQNFATKYAASGGYAPRFGQEMMKWSQESNVAAANQIFRQLQKPVNQEIMRLMGGQMLPDFTRSATTSGSSTAGSSSP